MPNPIKITIYGTEYSSIKEALNSLGIYSNMFYTRRNKYGSAEETIEAIIEEKKQNKDKIHWKEVSKETGIPESTLYRYKDIADTPEEIVEYIISQRKLREEKSELIKYCKEKGVSYQRYVSSKESPVYKDMAPKAIIDELSKPSVKSYILSVEIDGVTYPTLRDALKAYNISDERYYYARKGFDSDTDTIKYLINKPYRATRGKEIVVAGRTFDSVLDFCRYMNISTKSLYDRKRRYGYNDIEKCANDYYELVKKAGGSKDKKNFHKLSLKVNGELYHGLDDYLSKNNIKKKDFLVIKEHFYPELTPDKWFIVAKNYEKLRKKYLLEQKKVVRGKKYDTINDVCKEYNVSRSQVYWYRDVYKPGADAWDIIEDYLDYKEGKDNG